MKSIVELMIELEGYEPYLYKCSGGYSTIGIGHKLTKSELSSGKIVIADMLIKYDKGLTDEQIRQLLKQDLKKASDAVKYYVLPALSSNQRAALESFIFNIGREAFKTSTLRRRLNQGDYESVPFEMLRWVYSAGKVDSGLENRRRKEIEVWNGT